MTGQLKATEAAVRDYAEAADMKLGKVAQPLRAALTGRTTSPGVFDVWQCWARKNASPDWATVHRTQVNLSYGLVFALFTARDHLSGLRTVFWILVSGFELAVRVFS